MLSLAEVLKVHRAQGVPINSFSVKGEVECVLRNGDGSVAQHIRQPNIVTDGWRMAWFYNYNLGSPSIFISEWSDPMTVFRTMERLNFPGTFAQGSSKTVTGSTMTWLMQTTFAASSTRVVRTVGLYRNFSGNTTYNVIGPILAATVLGTPVTQLNTQTLEVNYRVLFQRT